MLTVTFEANTSKELKASVQEWLGQQERAHAKQKLEDAIDHLIQALKNLEDPFLSDLDHPYGSVYDVHSYIEENIKELNEVYDHNFNR